MNVKRDLPRSIALFNDFGECGPYTGQVEAVLLGSGLTLPVIRLVSNAPVCNPRASAYLLAALSSALPGPALFHAVVDPGVGGERLPLLLRTDRHWFVGPDNGLLSRVMHRSNVAELQVIEWRGGPISASFHGRDLFAPVVVALMRGDKIPGRMLPQSDAAGAEWPEDLAEIIYIDHYGNAYTGMRAEMLALDSPLVAGGIQVAAARTFCDAEAGQPFWYRNSIGLVEIAVNQGRADLNLGLKIGDPVSLDPAGQ